MTAFFVVFFLWQMEQFQNLSDFTGPSEKKPVGKAWEGSGVA